MEQNYKINILQDDIIKIEQCYDALKNKTNCLEVKMQVLENEITHAKINIKDNKNDIKDAKKELARIDKITEINALKIAGWGILSGSVISAISQVVIMLVK